MHALVVCRGEAKWSPEGHQVHGFPMNDRALRKRLGMTHELVSTETLADIEEAVLTRPADVALIMVSWKEDAEEVVQLFQRLHQRADRPRLIFLDYFAPASSPYYGVLPYVDSYFKRQKYTDISNYLERYEGGNSFTDFIEKDLKIDLKGWNFSSTPDPSLLHKIVHGWNLGVTPNYRKLLKLSKVLPIPWTRRPFAVNCRLGVSNGPRAHTEWYHHYRDLSAAAIAPIRAEYRCTGTNRVRLRQYFAEMLLSKIAISPFGWGEVCFRDYEVVASGVLLVKPSMEHLKTTPDIYVAGKTYVPCAWDMSDSVEICRHYLNHPEEAKEIIRNARKALSDYFEKDGFVDDVRRVLGHAGVEFADNGLATAVAGRQVPIMV